MPRCFVISPIGRPGSKVRDRADRVFDRIIKPALADGGIKAVRADKIRTPGQITGQMIAAILDYDFCIADVTGHNPNVFYELALAQAAERPVIILAEAGEPIPFDLKDYRLIEYDLLPRSVKSGKWVEALKESVVAIRDPTYRPPRLLPARGGAAPDSSGARFSKCPAELGTHEDWMALLRETTDRFDLCGMTLRSWRLGRAFGRELARKASEGCAVRILVMDVRNPVLRHLLNPKVPEQEASLVRVELRRLAKYFANIPSRSTRRQKAGVRVRAMKIGCPHFEICRTDRAATLLQCLYSESPEHSPLWRAPAGSELFRVAGEEFEALWHANEPASTRRRPTRGDDVEPGKPVWAAPAAPA